jgi:hypothetical protein
MSTLRLFLMFMVITATSAVGVLFPCPHAFAKSPDAHASAAAPSDDDDSASSDDDDSASPVAEAPATDSAPPADVPQWKANLRVEAPPYNSGLNLELSWTVDDDSAIPSGWAVLRSDSPDGAWEVRTEALTPDSRGYSDKLTDDPLGDPVLSVYHYRVLALPPGLSLIAQEPIEAAGSKPQQREDQSLAAYEQEVSLYAQTLKEAQQKKIEILVGAAISSPIVAGEPVATLFNSSIGYLLMLAIILAVGVMIFHFTAQVRAGKEIFIRRIPGIDAIEEGIGRATEMGKPVLYVPGIDELQDIQTIASMLILGEVSKKVAEYQSEIIVTCCIPIVREVADEVVRAGYTQAGYADDYRSINTRFISSEQFAFCAGTNGIILREKPATNIYLGRFFAESLILAETGFVNRSIQIAGTAEATQLPFFIAACDYTLIGEELFAVSAYLSKDPRLVSSLKASDWVKVFCVVCLVLGTILATFGIDFMSTLFTMTGG